MPFVPHTAQDIQQMLEAIGVPDIEQLFDEIPDHLRAKNLSALPDALSEMDISRHMRNLSQQDAGTLCYAGAGAYEHHIPAAIWQIVTRGEYYTAYTPYQAEASQGTLQLIYEYQSMMARLMDMDISNASLYDGASALAEAVLMAVRVQRKSKSKLILVPENLHPAYRQVLESIVQVQGVRLKTVPFSLETGECDLAAYHGQAEADITAVIVHQPSYFGSFQPVDQLTDWAHEQKALVIANCNPSLSAWIKPPGQWGEKGADIACGEGQPLGIPLSSGGPYFGFMTTQSTYVRQMPGRLCGKTVDLDGKTGYTLTLQAREQHIRRGRANSNICTNQGLAVAAATLYMALMGGTGLQQVAQASIQQTQALKKRLLDIPQVEMLFESDHAHEFAIKLPVSAEQLIAKLAEQSILAGVDLEKDYPQLGHSMLVCATETKNDQDHNQFAEALERALA